MADQEPAVQAQPDEEELSPEELEEAAGGLNDTNNGCNGNCPCAA